MRRDNGGTLLGRYTRARSSDRNGVEINTLASKAFGTVIGRGQIPHLKRKRKPLSFQSLKNTERTTHILSISTGIKVADKVEGQLGPQLGILLVGLDPERVELGAFIRT